MKSRLAHVSTSKLVWLFTAYSWTVTTLCASWFAHRTAIARGAPLDAATCLLWQGAVFGAWLPAGLLVWVIIRRFGTGARGLLAASAATLVVAPFEAAAGAVLDIVIAGRRDFSGLLDHAIAKIPVAILLWTAICAVALAATQRQRMIETRQRAEALEEALAQARHAQNPDLSERLMVMTGSRRTPVALDEVEWFASAGNYVVVHWGEREGLIRTTLKTMEAKLDPQVFARSHRSTLINLARVAETQSLSDGSWKLTMTSGAELVASRSFRDRILERLGQNSTTL